MESQAEYLGVQPGWRVPRFNGQNLHRTEVVHVFKTCKMPVKILFEDTSE